MIHDSYDDGYIRGILNAVKTNGKIASMRRPNNAAEPNEPDAAKLAALIRAYAPHDGTFALRIPGLHASRYSRINKEWCTIFACLACPSSRRYRPSRDRSG